MNRSTLTYYESTLALSCEVFIALPASAGKFRSFGEFVPACLIYQFKDVYLAFENLPKLVVVGGWSIEGRNFCAEQTQVDRHLTAMVRPMIDCVLNHLVARRFHNNSSARE